MQLSLDESGPVYQQVYRALRQAILTGTLSAGSRLLSTRDMAESLGVSRNTVMLAYEQLIAEGYVTGRVGAGTFVASPETSSPHSRLDGIGPSQEVRLSRFAQRALSTTYSMATLQAGPFWVDFKQGIPAVSDFPIETWRKLLSERARASAPEAFMYGPPEGSAELRDSIARYLRRSRRAECTAEQIIVTNGSQQAFDLIARTLVDPGDVTVIEEPCYPAARDVFLAAGSEIIPSSVDDQGMQIDSLPTAASRARLVYVTPSHQFPTGAVMSLQRRLALLAWARETGAYIVEDDYDSEFRYDAKPIEAVQGLQYDAPVIYVGTLSKTLSPSLRVGFMAVPRALVHALRTMKFLSDRHTSTLQQNVLTDFIEQGHFARHLRKVRRANAERRTILVENLQKEFGDRIEIAGTNAGLHVVVWFRNLSSQLTGQLVSLAADRRVGVYPLTPYYTKQPHEAGLLLGYAALETSEIRRGVALLARGLKEMPGI